MAKVSKLQLSKETLRELQDPELEKVAGGTPCPLTYCGSSPATLCLCAPILTDICG